MKVVVKNIWMIFNKMKEKTEEIKKVKEEELQRIHELDKKVDKKEFSDKKEWKSKYDLYYIFIFWLIWIFVLYIAYVLFNSLSLIYLILAAYIISIAMEAIIDLFQRIFPRILAILTSYILLLILLISWFIIIIPFVLAQSADIMQSFLNIISWVQDDLKVHWLEYVILNSPLIPQIAHSIIVEQLEDRDLIAALQIALQQNISQITTMWTTFINNVWSTVASIVWWFFSAILQVLLVFILAIFFSAQKDSVLKFIGSISWRKEYVIVKMQKLYKKLWFWLKWQFLLSIFIFVTVLILLNTIALFWIDLPNKFTLALIAWITEFIPIIWPILWAIPAILVAISEFWFVWFIVVVVIYTLIQLFENYVLVPIVMNQALWVSPLLIIIAMLIWWSLMWFVWIVLSVPIAVIANLIFEDLVD